MIGFCGAIDFSHRAVDFSLLRRMCGLHSGGCAFINKEFGVLCDGGIGQADDSFQPVTVKYNNSLYTAAIVMDSAAKGLEASTAQALLEGYFEEGEEYFRRLDFSYALALYDGRCGELLLRKGYKGDKPLFYTLKEGTLYFASSLRPLIRLYGGCVRVSKKVLGEHILAEPSVMPSGLFCDISSVPSGGALLCSAFGQTLITGERCPSACSENYNGEIIHTPYTKRENIRRILTDTLFAFGYPQFDCFMPSLLSEIKNKAAGRGNAYGINEVLYSEYPEYAQERAERLGRTWGIDIRPSFELDYKPTQRELRAIEKAIDVVLDGIYADSMSVIHRIFDTELLACVAEEKRTSLRIRKKAMICQTQIWAESFNLVFV